MIFLLIMGFCLVGCAMFLLGQYTGYQLGFWDGFDGGDEFGRKHADDPEISAIRWIACEKPNPDLP